MYRRVGSFGPEPMSWMRPRSRSFARRVRAVRVVSAIVAATCAVVRPSLSLIASRIVWSNRVQRRRPDRLGMERDAEAVAKFLHRGRREAAWWQAEIIRWRRCPGHRPQRREIVGWSLRTGANDSEATRKYSEAERFRVEFRDGLLIEEFPSHLANATRCLASNSPRRPLLRLWQNR